MTVLLGARQTGKTTLAHLLADRRRGRVTFFDLERPSARQALVTPELTLEECRGLVVIDEVQRMPELFEILRPLTDRTPNPARFLLLGSASPAMMRGVSESLAGRALFVQIGGFSLAEVGASRMNRLWLKGGFPRAFLAGSTHAWERWLEGFVATFLERDVPQLGVRVPPRALHRFWLMVAHYHGQVLNVSELGRSMDVSPATARSYLDILAGMYLVRLLPPWHANLKKRQVKSPKVFVRDSGILHHLVGVGSMADLRANPRYGASWEGFALEQTLRRHGENQAFFWASQRGAELDLLLIRKGKKWGFEFKCSDAPSTTRSMHVALQDLGLAGLFVVYPGGTSYPMGEGIRALPLPMVFDLAW